MRTALGYSFSSFSYRRGHRSQPPRPSPRINPRPARLATFPRGRPEAKRESAPAPPRSPTSGTRYKVESSAKSTIRGSIPRTFAALEFAVSDGKTVWLESKDLQHSIERTDNKALIYRQTSRDPASRFTITKTYATEPARDTLLIDVTFSAPDGYTLYVLYDPALKNPGMGDTAFSQDDALVTEKPGIASALVCNDTLQQMTSGFAGTSDGYTDLLLHKKLAWSYARAENGNVIQSAKLPAAQHFTLALGFGGAAADAVANAKASLREGFPSVSARFAAGWNEYVQTLRPINGPYAYEFHLAAMVLKAHEDKTFRAR